MTRQLVRSLATLAQPSSSRASTSLIPPYSHSLSELKSTPAPAFKPPYSHSLTPSASPKGKLVAPYKYTLVSSQRSTLDSQRINAFNVWAQSQLSSDEGRDALWTAWMESVNELEKVRSNGNHIPEISFRDLAEQLKSDSTVHAILQAGTVVVRDVVADQEADQWFREILDELNERQGRASFWSSTMLEARAHTSVLSANNQILSAVTGSEQPSLIQADTAQVGIASAGARTTNLNSPWSTNEESLAPTTPLLAHLALTTGNPGRITPTIHAAIYASLRPFFTPARSKISFYDNTSYLDPSNWKLVTPDAIPQYGVDNALTFPHLDESSVLLPKLNAGDIIYRHVSVPVSVDGVEAKQQGASLPITPLPRVTVNETYIAEQRNSFERGLPPPHARAGGMVALETMGTKEAIKSSGGRRSMGY